MSSNNSQNSSDSDNLCVVCFKNLDIYSIGCCDHAVCFECSTRMRVLCKQNECPICRRDLPKVLFSKTVQPFSLMYSRFEKSNLQERKYGIIFTTSDVQRAYIKLLEHHCYICKQNEHTWPFKTFSQLKDHMRREHELFYCDFCSNNLKIFSFERRCYTRQELALHKRKGDKDNTSHRGHPLCEFCDTRFMDNDELFRHLRRNHLFCHFCDADGKHQYYDTMEGLKRHFREEHFLCEEGECKTMPLTAVFRSHIDFKAHVAQEHARFLSKSATKQARTLELEFTLAPRPRSETIRNKRPERSDRRERCDGESTSFNDEPNQTKVFINPLTSDEFPALRTKPTTSTNIASLPSKNYTKFSNAAFSSNDFPSLGEPSSRSSPAVTITTNSTGNSAPEVTITRTVRQPNQKVKEKFPALGGSSKPGSSTVRLSVNSNQQQTPKVSIQVNQNLNGVVTTQITTNSASSSQRTEVFPVLGKPRPVPQAQWVQPTTKKQEEPKSSKLAECPVLEPSDLKSFPNLSKGKGDKPKKSSSVTVPVDSWVNLTTMKNSAKNMKKVEDNSNRTENKGGGGNKAGESSKKTNDNGASIKSQTNVSPLSQFENLKLVDASDKGKPEDSKKSKKKKMKNIGDLNNSVPESNKDLLKLKKESIFNENEEEIMNKNGLTKKRSELKVDNISKNTVSTTSNSEDVSTLGSKKPPPGFKNKPLQTQSPVKPPPGFNNSNFPSLNLSNDLTFTNSSGQSYAISPTNNSSFRQPRNFQVRNQNLIKKIMEVLNDNDTIKEFKTLSENFRKGDVSAQIYYEHCLGILGNKFNEIFPELLILLPDISKQQELYTVMNKVGINNLIICENCRQVIFKRELHEHYNHHRLDNHFPSLGTAQQINTAWNK